MTKLEERGKRACKTVEKKMDGAIGACWKVSHASKTKINCHPLHHARGKLVKACRKLK